MKTDLFLAENEDLKLSSLYLGYEVLKLFKNKERITIYDLFGSMQKKHPELNHSNFMNSLTFLHMAGIVEFKKPYIEVAAQ